MQKFCILFCWKFDVVIIKLYWKCVRVLSRHGRPSTRTEAPAVRTYRSRMVKYDPFYLGSSKKDAHKVFSSTFKDFLPTANGQPLEELYYAYCALIKENMLDSVSDERPLSARSTSTNPGSTLAPPISRSETRKRKRDETKDFLSAPIEIVRNKDELAIYHNKALSSSSQAELLSTQAAVAKGDAIKQLRQASLILIRDKNEVDDDFYRILINSRIEILERVLMDFCKPGVAIVGTCCECARRHHSFALWFDVCFYHTCVQACITCMRTC